MDILLISANAVEADSPAWEVEGEGGIVGSSLATPDHHHAHLRQSTLFGKSRFMGNRRHSSSSHPYHQTLELFLPGLGKYNQPKRGKRELAASIRTHCSCLSVSLSHLSLCWTIHTVPVLLQSRSHSILSRLFVRLFHQL